MLNVFFQAKVNDFIITLRKIGLQPYLIFIVRLELKQSHRDPLFFSNKKPRNQLAVNRFKTDPSIAVNVRVLGSLNIDVDLYDDNRAWNLRTPTNTV